MHLRNLTRACVAAAAALVSMVALPALGYNACSCSSCNWLQEHSGKDLVKGSAEYFARIEPAGATAGKTASSPAAFAGTQTVFLDYDSATGAGEYNYTAADRTAIRDGIASIYSQFNIAVTNTAPVSGAFSTITFNSGGPGGLADGIDFRNTNQSDNAVVNINGLGGLPAIPAAFVPASINVGAHELGHILGLRHGDSYGTIGDGIVPGNVTDYNPNYPGPTDATETGSNIMSSPASVGSGIGDLLTPSSMSARSAAKLAFAQSGTVTAETAAAHGTIGTAQALTLPTIAVPNTALPTDELFGLELQADAEVVAGSIAVGGENDFYSFAADAGDLLNIEVISNALDFANPIDSRVSVVDGTGTAINYYGSAAFNDDELETFDSILIDLVIETAGTYFIEVDAFSAADTGNYELYVTRIEIVPEPNSLVIMAALTVGVLARRRRAA